MYEQPLPKTSRNIKLLFIGKLISLLGASMYTFICGMYILKLTGSGSQFALAAICGTLPRILLSPLVGVLADRCNPKKIIIWADLVSCAVMIMTFLMLSVTGTPLFWIYLSIVLMSGCASFYSVTLSSSLMKLVDLSSIQRASSMNQIASSIGNISGPIVGGILFALIPLQLFSLFNTAGYLVSALMGMALTFHVVNQIVPSASQGTLSIWSSLREGIVYIRSSPLIWTLLIFCFCINFFAIAIEVTLPYITVHTMHLTTAAFGWIEASMAMGMLLMASIMSFRKPQEDVITTLIRGLLLLSLLIIGMSLPYIEVFNSYNSNYITFYYLVYGGNINFDQYPCADPLTKNDPRTVSRESPRYRGDGGQCYYSTWHSYLWSHA
ncbi:MFS family permease [Paenibacillus shirakamiensis]|uniref:MFS family permease n=1 Tax=Paenibacillus shirakamiensis TaxID=1265935 RepID=A0ABS4JK49_9BACL|nr:MFS transporter [Paenibacillus shirakamiensis]MBP2002089.1 MFS family permease [Paenibacillus shirakamiensis]